MSKADDAERIRPRPDGDPACGPWRHYLEDQAEQDRKARIMSDEDCSCYAHERQWEARQLEAVCGLEGKLQEIVVRAFYVGRASADRERPHGRRMVSEALNACHIRYQRAAAEAFAQIMRSRGAE